MIPFQFGAPGERFTLAARARGSPEDSSLRRSEMFIDRKTMNLPAPFEGAERYYLGTGQVEFRPFERRRTGLDLHGYKHLTPPEWNPTLPWHRSSLSCTTLPFYIGALILTSTLYS